MLVNREAQPTADLLAAFHFRADFAECADLKHIRIIPAFFQCGMAENKAQRLFRVEQPFFVAHDDVVSIFFRSLVAGFALALIEGGNGAFILQSLGAGALQRSTLRRKVNREEHAEVPAEFMKWVWAGGRKLKGLVKRRRAESELYLN